MKINIGPYKYWFGPHQLAEKIFFWTKFKDEYGLDEYPEWVDKVGGWLADREWLLEFMRLIDKKFRQRKIDIRIDKYDTWGMDHTLAMIIVPMLKQLRDTTHGYPAQFCYEDQNFGPQQIFKGEGFEFPDDGFEQWKETLNKMIWSFEQVLDDDWEDQYRTGELDWSFEECEDKPGYSRMVDGPNHTLVTDWDGIQKHRERMQEGFDLFAKYYEGLWD
jgi:hypothetical protein